MESATMTCIENTMTQTTISKQLDENGTPILPPPPTRWWLECLSTILVAFISPVLIPPFVLIGGKLKFKEIIRLARSVWDATGNPIQKLPEYQDSKYLRQVYKQASAKHYIEQDALMWQPREGYCGKTTLYCALASYSSVPRECLPEVTNQPVQPESFCSILKDTLSKSSQISPNNLGSSKDTNSIPNIEGEVVSGRVPYSTFLRSIRRVRNDSERVVVNFHRGVLFGYNKKTWWSPGHHIMTTLFGHFSPVIAVLETESADNPLVAIFDVNHKYGGTYLVPARRMYEAIHAPDVTTGRSRAMVVLTNKDSLSHS